MTKDNKTNKKQTMTDEELNQLSIKIVSRMMNIQTMSEWYEHVSSSDIAIEIMDKKLNVTEEENAIGDVAKYMTLMTLFEDKVGKCIFVGKPNKLITKYGSQLDDSYYKLNTDD